MYWIWFFSKYVQMPNEEIIHLKKKKERTKIQGIFLFFRQNRVGMQVAGSRRNAKNESWKKRNFI